MSQDFYKTCEIMIKSGKTEGMDAKLSQLLLYGALTTEEHRLLREKLAQKQ